MKIQTLHFFFFVVLMGINADSNKRPKKIQAFIENLVNVSPNTSKLLTLWKPLQLDIYNHLKNVTYDLTNTNFKFNLLNVTTNKSIDDHKSNRSYFIEFTCTYHQQLQINLGVEPHKWSIAGQYETYEMSKLLRNDIFNITLSSGRIFHKVLPNNSCESMLIYREREIDTGKTGDNEGPIYQAMSELIEDVKNPLLNEMSKTYISSKIADFQHIFPFLNNCLLAENRTTNRLPENSYVINHTVTKRWKSFNLSLAQVVIYGINDFKQANITAQGNNSSNVRFNMTIVTNPLEGHFGWNYTRSGEIASKQHRYNFTIDNLTLTADANFSHNWTVNRVDAIIGDIRIHRNDTGSPDVNEFAYNILHDHLRVLITSHLKMHIHDGYSENTDNKSIDISDMQELEHLANSFSATKNNKADLSSVNIESTSIQNRLNEISTTAKANSQKVQTTRPIASDPPVQECTDRRGLLQKIFHRNPCKSTNGTGCVDTRRWFNIFHRNPCKVINDKISGCVDTRRWYNIFTRDPCKK